MVVVPRKVRSKDKIVNDLRALAAILEENQLQKHPERVLEAAVRGMLPKNRLGRRMMRKLKVYAGDSHPHRAQQPKVLEL